MFFALVTGGTILGRGIADRLSSPPSVPVKLDCAARCAPRFVLASSAATCECSPDASWVVSTIDVCEKKCVGLPYDVRAERDGSIECRCGRPEKIRRVWAAAADKEN
jgi:hypothetical protein